MQGTPRDSSERLRDNLLFSQVEDMCGNGLAKTNIALHQRVAAKRHKIIQKIRWILRHWNHISPDVLTAWLPVSRSLGDKLNFCSDGLAVQNNCDCLSDERFASSYRKSLKVDDWRGSDGTAHDMRWRYYLYCKFAELAFARSGDFVECGVYKGGYALAAMEFTRFENSGRKFHLLDTYQGLSARHVTASERERDLLGTYAHYESCYDEVVRTFAGLPARIIRGTVPETLPQCQPEKVAFLSLDMNCVGPEVAALRHFWPMIPSGGVVLHDDYGFAAHIEQKLAMDDVSRELGAVLVALPTGQAVIFKP